MTVPMLKPGDCLVYGASSLMGRLIAIKTWDENKASHVEVMWDSYTAIGARPEGVRRYPVRYGDLIAVMRPDPALLDLNAAKRWYLAQADGLKYDVMGLTRFLLAGSRFGRWVKPSADKLFCSELATRFYRAGGLNPFNRCESDLVPPGWFVTLADNFAEVYRA